jgi:hypothetical protein
MSAQASRSSGSKTCRQMSLLSFYLHKVEQCTRLARDATDARDFARFASERCEWLGFLAEEIGADVGLLEAAIALLPMEDGNTD